MGQYFRGVCLRDDKQTIKAHVVSYDFNDGAKLMEHSWIRNPFVRSFERLILNNPSSVVWAGDYAERFMEQTENTYDLCTPDTRYSKSLKMVALREGRYIVNHTKKEYVDKQRVARSVDGWRIHPLPLLTCEGNGEGGGDFYGESGKEYVGIWARDVISIEGNKPEGYTQIKPNFVE